jgi:hypothetical protein
MADALERGEEDRPYLDALLDSYDGIDDHYSDLCELGIFDWWWVSRETSAGSSRPRSAGVSAASKTTSVTRSASC